MRFFIKGFVALALVAVLTTTAAGPVRADGLADYGAAVAAQRAGNLDEAIRLYTRAIRSGQFSGKRLGAVYVNRGTSHARKRKHDRAIADYTKALKRISNDGIIHYARGNQYHKKRQYDRALADLTKAIQLKSDYANAYGVRGQVYEATGKRDQAIADYRRAVKLRTNDRMGMAGLKRLGATP